MLTGISQGSGRRSVSTPNSGCTTEDSRVAASVMPGRRDVAEAALGDQERNQSRHGALVHVHAGMPDRHQPDRSKSQHTSIVSEPTLSGFR